MAGFNVGPSQNFMGGVARRPQPSIGGGGMNPGMGRQGMGMDGLAPRPMSSNPGMGGGGMSMPSPNRYPSPQPSLNHK